jgi:sec-independent protein translocase protein TatA
MFGISTWQLLVIAVIVAMIFGTKRLRQVGEDIGVAVKSFEKCKK